MPKQTYLFVFHLRESFAGCTVKLVPFVMGYRDIGGVCDGFDSLRIYCADDGLHLCGMTENPCNSHSCGVCAVLFADFLKLLVKLLVVRVSYECSAEETELEGRPRAEW